MTSTRGEDGKWVHRIRQSTLSGLTACPELVRLEETGEVERTQSDAAFVGTVVHAVIAETLLTRPQMVPSLYETYDRQWFNHLMKEEYEWLLFTSRTPEQAYAFGAHCLGVWDEHVRPHLSPHAIEYSFEWLLHADKEREVWLTGTIDYVDTAFGLMDWKTSGGEHRELWQKRRWDIQSTVYTWAMRQEIPEFRPDFTFVVLHPGPEPQTYKVERGPEWDGWLKEQVMSWVPFFEAELPVWPKTDDSWKCSPKFCGAFAAHKCKGAHLASEPWAAEYMPNGNQQ